MSLMNEDAEFELNFDPIDWKQLELLAQLTPAERTLAMMRAQAFVMAGLRGAFAKRFPELSQSELNMKVLAYLQKPVAPEQLLKIVAGALEKVPS